MISVAELAAAIGAQVIGPTDGQIANAVVLGANEDPTVLAWCNAKSIGKLADFRAGAVIVPSIEGVELIPGVTYLVVDEPRRAFQTALERFFAPTRPVGTHPSAVLESPVGHNCFIGANVVIEPNCQIGDEVVIDANTVVKAGTRIGHRVTIGANSTIGGAGFGYERDIDGQYVMIPHLGVVVLEDGVEIGNNTAIDRAVLGETRLRRNVKVDNLVHIAHGCDIGENSLVIAHAMIAGSTKIGANVWVAPCAAVINKTTVGDNAVVGMGAVVTKPVEAGDVVVGSPARSIKKRD
ncbi:MAG: hypothetical protein JNJ45_05945 [Chthonomonas sp.]|nr:hypothetical protein [Chthonomonas sp.]